MYIPLGVHVGPTAPASGYTLGNLTFNTVVTGFLARAPRAPREPNPHARDPPDLGYGPLNQSCLGTKPMVYTLPVLTFDSLREFATLYPNVATTVGLEFPDPTYGWNDTVFAVNTTTVVVEALATLGATTHPNGLPFVVSSLNATTITLSSELTPGRAPGSSSVTSRAEASADRPSSS